MTEQQIEQALVQKLGDLKYTYRPDIRDRAALEQNFREKFEALNRVRLTENEFSRLMELIITPDVFMAARTLRERNSFERDDGTPLFYTLVNIRDWCKNSFEVVNQLRITTDYSRHHALLDWTGDGLDEIVVAYDGAIYDHRGRRIATLAVPGAHTSGRQPVEQQSILLGDMDGDGVPDVLIVTNTAVTIYRNENGARPKRSVPLGTGPNVTLY